jgi:hypothetical protein
MSLIIKNIDSVSHTYAGQTITAGGQYTIQTKLEQVAFSEDDSLLSDISSGLAVVNDGVADVAGVSAQIRYLSGSSVEVAALPEPQPFALPTYRTKRAATSSIATCAPGTSQTIDYILAAERYVTGGRLIVENAVLGDYITAEVYDGGSVIPAPYRSAMCENWPTVGVYIEKEWIDISSGGTASSHEINTYPLNAKITAGLYLRVTYYATAGGSNRNIAINYYLTKKL